MSSDIAIRVNNLGKCYQIYDKPGDRLKQSLWRGRKKFYREFWALHDISFEVKKGETVGIIGRNGSGKSTLLQLICGTLTSTTGEIQINGRIAALLELGSGFNPEFTGRENVYMNATILGLSRQEIDAKYDEIVAFADIGDFIEQPVKTYSSGMYVRLAFSVAINVEPDILVIDEALSVGDHAFQHKCISRFSQIIAGGASILFVSHDVGTVQAHCQRALWLDRGNIRSIGKASEISDRYYQSIIEENVKYDRAQQVTAPRSEENILKAAPTDYKRTQLRPVNPSKRWGRKGIEITEWALCNNNGDQCNSFHFRDKMKIIMRLSASKDIPACFPGFLLRDLRGNFLTGITSRTCGYELENLRAGDELQLTFTVELLYAADNYTIMLNVACDDRGADFYDVCENVANFFIVADPVERPRYGYGRVFLPTTLEIIKAGSAL